MRTIIIFITLFLCLHANAEDCFRLKASKEEINHIQIGRLFTKSDTIMSLSKGAISGLCISGSFEKKSDDYLIRIILMDKAGNEHLVMESYDMLNSDLKVTMDDYCEETAFLEDVEPDYIKVIVNDATLIINNIGFTTTSNKDSRQTIEREAQRAEVKKEQKNSIIKRINAYNATHGRPWIAGETTLSGKCYADKKRLLGFPDDVATGGYEYYSDGFFIAGHVSANRSSNRPTSNYVSSFDWRNRHGKNWVTPVKNQGDSKCCVAFASAACMESLYMLYYNDTTKVDFSEAEIAFCSNPSGNTYNNGEEKWKAMHYLRDFGVHDESLNKYKFLDDSLQTCMTDSNDPNELVNIAGYDSLRFDHFDDSIKHWIIHYGPIMSGYSEHAMQMVGYDVLTEETLARFYSSSGLGEQGSFPNNLIGETYWIFKNSYGGQNDSNLGGYRYVIFGNGGPHNTHNYYMNRCYYFSTPITSTAKTSNDIICEDADGDGYYFWGLGPKPSHCPSWVTGDEDGDDSNINYGPLDVYGNLEILPSGLTIKTTVTYSSNTTTSKRFGIVNGGKLKITGTTSLIGNGKIRVCEGGTLEINGGTLQNADIVMVPGCTVIIKNNGKINMASGKNFEAPVGAVVIFESGEIN